MRRLWRFFTRPSPRLAVGLLLVVGGVLGVLFWGGFHTAMEQTNRLEFCVSCHEMSTVYAEYQQSIHFKNASGVRAICSDCHVPHEWLPKVVRKIYATNELYHKLVGTIDTPEKFEKKRLQLARNVWKSMEETDSRECRNCHSFQAMDFHKQREAAAKEMEKAAAEGATCISCHKGIAHKLPDMAQGYKAMFEELVAAGAAQADSTDTLYTLATKPLFIEKPANADATPDGKLMAASEVKVVERDGDWLKISIEGWQQQDAERVLNAMQGKRIMTAALTEDAVGKVQQSETMTDADTDLVWHRGTLTAWVTKDQLTADRDKLWAYGAEMFNGSCGTCHKLPLPDHYLANQWIGTLNAMKRFITLDDEQYRFLQKYLQLNAKDTGGAHG